MLYVAASLELPSFLANAVEKLMLSIVPDIQGELAGGIDEYLKGLKEPELEPEPAVRQPRSSSQSRSQSRSLNSEVGFIASGRRLVP